MRNQSDRAYEELRRRLLAHAMPTGSRIREVEWAAELGVNRGDIRVALSRLRAEGLVVRGTRGCCVRDYNGQYIRQLNEARVALEAAAAKLAAARVTPAEVRELGTLCEQMRLMAENGYLMGFAEVDVRFHTALVKAAHNEKLLEVYQHASIPISQTRTPLDTPEAVRRQLLSDADEHARILQALKDKDLSTLVSTIERGMP
jgi:DNA-binding GntR family transcriptional regulator